MFYLSREYMFSASHQLPLHDGKCRELHGHNWKLTVIVCGRNLATSGPKTGMLMDFTAIDAMVQPLLVNVLDHHHLNETLDGEPVGDNPTSELIAQWLWGQLAQPVMNYRQDIDHGNVRLYSIMIDESDRSRCVYAG